MALQLAFTFGSTAYFVTLSNYLTSLCLCFFISNLPQRVVLYVLRTVPGTQKML